MVATVALMAMVSCNKEEINNGAEATKPSYYVEFTAEIVDDNTETVPTPANAQTRTSYDASSKTTRWTTGDLISVNGKKFEIKELSSDGLSASFINAEELGEDFKAPYTAIYPYNTTSGTAVVPTEQTVSNGTFPEESVVTIAYSASDNVLSFKHVCSVVKFQVATEGVNELTFSSATNIAGTISVNANNGGEPSYTTTSGSKTITVKPANGTFKTNEIYYVSVLPTTTAQKFEIKAEGVTVKSGDVTFKRNKVMDAKILTVNYVYVRPSAHWRYESARFAAYFYQGDQNIWVNLTFVESNVYRAVCPEGYGTVIFCRMNPKATENKWENKWNQTNDLVVSTNIGKVYLVKHLTWDKGEGSWTSLDSAKKYFEPVVYFDANGWETSSAKLAVYLCNGTASAKWIQLNHFINKLYAAELPSKFDASLYKNIIFVRKPSDASLDWNNIWNQTSDLSCSEIVGGKFCCKPSKVESYCSVSWSKW